MYNSKTFRHCDFLQQTLYNTNVRNLNYKIPHYAYNI